MRIILITGVYPGAQTGGAEVQTMLLAQGLVERGHQVLFLATESGVERHFVSDEGIIVQELPGEASTCIRTGYLLRSPADRTRTHQWHLCAVGSSSGIHFSQPYGSVAHIAGRDMAGDGQLLAYHSSLVSLELFPLDTAVSSSPLQYRGIGHQDAALDSQRADPYDLQCCAARAAR